MMINYTRLSLALCIGVMGIAGTAQATVTATGDYLPDHPTNWNSSSTGGRIGDVSVGSMTIDGGSSVSNRWGYIGFTSGSLGTVTVTGAGSIWDNDNNLKVGYSGTGIMNVENGGLVHSLNAIVGRYSNATGTVTVTDNGSVWTNEGTLELGVNGYGTLDIDRGGLVVTAGLYIDYVSNQDSYIHIAAGGMLALGNYWEEGDGIDEFLESALGTDQICYHDGAGWINITNGTENIDYMLEYFNPGELVDDDFPYTKLTVILRPTVATIETAVGISWVSESGTSYQVQYTTNLTSSSWIDLGPTVIGDGLTNHVFDYTGGKGGKYYQVTIP